MHRAGLMSARKKPRNRRSVEAKKCKARSAETVEKKKENRYNIVLTGTNEGTGNNPIRK